jgi:hypothetical protein
MSASAPCCDDVRIVEPAPFAERLALDRRMRRLALRAAITLALVLFGALLATL